MLSLSKIHVAFGRILFLAIFAISGLICQPASAVLISFEQSEGFPAPTLVPDMAPGGIRNPLWNFTGFAGGTNTGYAAHPSGPVLDKPLFSTNSGAVTNWGVASQDFDPGTPTNEAREVGSWFIDDGPGGIDLMTGSVPTCLGAPATCNPAPVSGNQMAIFGFGMEGGVGFKYAGEVDFDNAQDFQLDSFWYANRGNGPPRLQVEYYDTDDTTLLGVNTFAEGVDLRDETGEPDASTAGDRWVGVAANYDPQFQQFTPSPAFQGVALGKVIFRSFADGFRTEAPLFDNLGNGDTPNAHPPAGPGGHGHFFLDDISITAGGSAYNPNGLTRISFESDTSGPEAIPLCQGCAGGFPDTDGTLVQDGPANPVFTMSNGVVTSITNDAFANAELKVDHGPGGISTNSAPGGYAGPNQHSDTEPEVPHGYQALHSQAGANGDHGLTIDLENGPGYSFEGLWYANRGNGPPRLRIQYFDTNENLIGENAFTKSDKGAFGVGLGQFDGFRPEYQFFEPSALFRDVALSKIKILSENPHGAGGSATFMIDDVQLKAGGGAFVEPGDFRISFEASEGFSDNSGDQITGAFPAGVVSSWSSSGAGSAQFQIDEGRWDAPNGTAEDDDPVSGEQFGFSNAIGNGDHIVEMDLVNAATLALDSFFFAFRGNSPHDLTVEYFDLNEQSLGSDVFSGDPVGNPNNPTDGIEDGGFDPDFEQITPSASFLNVALSKVIFTTSNASGLGAIFALDDIVLSTVTTLPGDFNMDGTVDGLDFLEWQRTGGTPAGLTAWQTNYGMTSLLAAASTAVPEPTSVTLWLLGLVVGSSLSLRRTAS